MHTRGELTECMSMCTERTALLNKFKFWIYKDENLLRILNGARVSLYFSEMSLNEQLV